MTEANRICMLRIINEDATPKMVALQVNHGAIPDVLEWYDAFCAGDDYKVYVDGHPYEEKVAA